ncbi:hypothetical protein M3Y95_01089700 [Aphelenchoides besseyi]|nr:hypothetical protein M3Y95_01089700 [Aphelenchoides besseyi]
MSSILQFFVLLVTFTSINTIRLPYCHFLMRDWNGIYVEVMRKCPAGTSYCATRVSNSTGIKSLVIDYYEHYCENEKNISHYLKAQAPTDGCYKLDDDEHVCFCETDFCNNRENIENLFLRVHRYRIPSQSTTTVTPIEPSTSVPFVLRSEFKRNLSPLINSERRRRSKRETKRQSFEQKVVSQKLVLANGNPKVQSVLKSS